MEKSKKKKKKKTLIEHLVNILRKGSVTWSGRTECLNNSRIQVSEGSFQNGKEKLKWHWKCSKCGKLFRDVEDMEVDHIVEIGPFTGDWNEYISRLYCGPENLQCLCIECHAEKTAKYNMERRGKRNDKELSKRYLDEDIIIL